MSTPETASPDIAEPGRERQEQDLAHPEGTHPPQLVIIDAVRLEPLLGHGRHVFHGAAPQHVHHARGRVQVHRPLGKAGQRASQRRVRRRRWDAAQRRTAPRSARTVC